MQYFDLPREDVMDNLEAWNSGAWGGFLVTQLAEDFDAYMLALNNPLIMPLLQALVGSALHLMEVGARTVLPQPLEYVQKHGAYTRWHRDYGNDGLRRPIGPASDYCRCKCFLMLSDTEADGGPLGLVPGSHLWPGTPPPEYLDGAHMASLPGHVKCAVPAGGMILFE
jgi:ectoine hydroxylase-related dioxygenase (phytanoyl-CoA dioxygenase family)